MILLLSCIISTTLSGNVYDINTKEPLQAHVFIVETNQIHVCNTQGTFTVPELPLGTHGLVVSHIGYKDETLTVVIQQPDTINIRIGLRSTPIDVEQVETKAERIVAPGKRTFTKEEMGVIPGAEKDIFRAIQMIPGVSAATDYLGLFYVRGGELYENKVLFDHVEILSPYHYFGIGSAFNVDLIEDFEFHIGTVPVRYGDAVSSVLLVNSRQADIRQNGVVSIDPIEANFFCSKPFTRNLSVALSAKRNYLDVLLRELGIVEGVLLPYFFDLQAKVSIGTKYGNFSLNGLRSKEGTDIQASFAEETVELQMNGVSNTFWLDYDINASEELSLQTYVFYGNMNRYLHGEVPTGTGSSETATEEYDVQKYGTYLHMEYSPGFVTLTIGGGIGRYELMHTGPRIEDIFYKIGSINYSLEGDTTDYYSFLYATQRFSILDLLNCEFGERIDWLPAIKDPVFSPRIKLVHKKRPNLFFAYGYHYQTPPLEYQVQEYEPLKAKSLSIGVEHLIIPGLLGKIEYYKKEYENLIRGYPTDLFFNDGTGTASGIEFSLRKYRVGRLYGMISYAYSRSKRTSPYDSTVVTSDVHRPHILNVFLGNRLPAGFEVGIKLQVSSGLAYRPVIGREGHDQWMPIYSPTKERLPYYQRIDVHVEKEFSLWGMQGELYVTLLNITNHKNIQGYLYNGDYTLRKAIYQLPRMPLVGIRMKF